MRAAIMNIGETVSPDNMATTPDILRTSFRKVLELGITFRELGCEKEDRIEFFLTIVRPGSIGERWPMYGTFLADLPGENFEEEMWEV